VWIDDVALVEVESLDEWQSLQALGFDRQSVVADPLFVAPEKTTGGSGRVAGPQTGVPAHSGREDRPVPGPSARLLADREPRARASGSPPRREDLGGGAAWT